jgi:hypothetical protein
MTFSITTIDATNVILRTVIFAAHIFKIFMLSVAMQNVVLLSVIGHTKSPSKVNIYNTKNFIYFTQNKKIVEAQFA